MVNVADPTSDPLVLNLALNLSLEFGPEWRKPIQARLRLKVPALSESDADELNRISASTRDNAHALIERSVHQGTPAEDEARRELREAYPWIDDETLLRLWNQGLYFAMRS
jgi:hypothetical protein